MRDTKRPQLLELPCVILFFSVEDDYQRNINVTKVCIETESCRYEKKEPKSGVRFSKVPETFRAREAIRKTPTRLFCEAGLFICCKANKN